ncbi:hypothetical protein SNE40_005522 [Patella caerulea]|uniref:Uncharacterized protein n=1 Tax=Patella caerulea TaxID=87958 RepID=A0AAN8K1L5_PATCE
MRLSDWLDKKTNDERKALFKEARCEGLTLRKTHKEFETTTKTEMEQNLVNESAKQKRKRQTISKHCKKQVENDDDDENDNYEKDEYSNDNDILADGDNIDSDDWIAVAFDNGWFPGMVTSVCDENVIVDFLQPTSLPCQFKRPTPKDELQIKRIYVFAGPLLPPVPTSGGRLYSLPQTAAVELSYKKFKAK